MRRTYNLSLEIGEAASNVHYTVHLSMSGDRSTDCSNDRVEASPRRMPFRIEAFEGATVRVESYGDVDLLEINRVLKYGGVLRISSRDGEVELEYALLQAGFTVSVRSSVESGEVTTVEAKKTWRRYYPDACPRCGGDKVIPLVPPDSRVGKTWSVYCSSCSYNWSVATPISRFD